MFDVGFFELLLIGIVALLVVGPERLPKLARSAGMWLGRGRRFISSVKDDIDREIKADELRQILEKQKKNNPLHEIVEDTKSSFEQIRSDTESAVTGKPKSSGSNDKHDG
jgi:sec-independent protein translocase protein TatB